MKAVVIPYLPTAWTDEVLEWPEKGVELVMVLASRWRDHRAQATTAWRWPCTAPSIGSFWGVRFTVCEIRIAADAGCLRGPPYCCHIPLQSAVCLHPRTLNSVNLHCNIIPVFSVGYFSARYSVVYTSYDFHLRTSENVLWDSSLMYEYRIMWFHERLCSL